MDNPANPPIKAFLAQRASEGASADQIADLIVSAWQQVDLALASVIGQRGVTALYKRSIHLASASHPALAAAQPNGAAKMALDSLKSVLARQASAEAAATGATLLLSFHGLVGSLIGPALSGQLLGGVWVNFLSGAAAQDPSP